MSAPARSAAPAPWPGCGAASATPTAARSATSSAPACAPQLWLVDVDYQQPRHASALLELLDLYARDPMGGGQPLAAQVRADLPAAMAARAHLFSVLAFDGPGAGAKAIGLMNCVEGFSTFAARPLVNVHDVVVHPDWRGRGVARALFARAELLARARGACKLTLEVLSGNQRALALYLALDFVPYQLDPQAGQALFMHKALPEPDGV